MFCQVLNVRFVKCDCTFWRLLNLTASPHKHPDVKPVVVREVTKEEVKLVNDAGNIVRNQVNISELLGHFSILPNLFNFAKYSIV